MKIVTDKFFNNFFWVRDFDILYGRNFDGAEVAGFSICDISRLDEYQDAVDRLLASGFKKIMINIMEPTKELEVIDFVKNNQDPRILLFGDFVPNFQVDNFQPVISWFIDSENYYATRPWARQLLEKLTYRDYSKKYKFDCLLGLQRTERDMIEKFYLNSGLEDSIYFTYYKSIDQIEKLGSWNFVNVKKHTDKGLLQLVVTNDQQVVNRYSVIPVDIYNDSYYSIVSETTSFNSFNQYTEKIAKPIVAKRLFVVFAGQYYLKNLRSLGFKTFDGIIDESYDLEPDREKRFKLAWQQVEILCNTDPKKIINLCQPILNYNRDHFITTDWWEPLRLLGK